MYIFHFEFPTSNVEYLVHVNHVQYGTLLAIHLRIMIHIRHDTREVRHRPNTWWMLCCSQMNELEHLFDHSII